MAKCTNLTFLMIESDDGAFEKLVDITEYPDLFGAPEKLDATTLSDTQKRNILGIQEASDMTFKAWYESADFDKLVALKGLLKKYRLCFGDEAGKDGIFEWEGKLDVYISSGGVNAVREMSFSISDEGEESLHKVTAA